MNRKKNTRTGSSGFTVVDLPVVSKRKSIGFTLVELLVVIAIIALLVAIIMPTLSSAKRKAERIHCVSNLKQFGPLFELYISDYEKHPVRGGPGGGFWTEQMYPDYLSEAKLLMCPTEMKGQGRIVANDPGPDSTYWYGAGDVVNAAGQTISYGFSFTDGAASTEWVLCDYYYTDCHEIGKNVLFADGHVNLVVATEVKVNTGEQPLPLE